MVAALKDAESARFRNERLGKVFICGEVNSRGASGGYVGFKRYISSPGGVFAIEGDAQHGLLRPHEHDVILRAYQVMAGRPMTEAEALSLLGKQEFEATWNRHCN